MGKYRKKPVTVEAFKWLGSIEQKEEPIWIVKAIESGNVWIEQSLGELSPRMYIKTLEGIHEANVGDYIIQGIKGELYPCKADIFRETYEEVLY
ncbi:TPA: hypothetical protein JDY68_12585 [Clostridioides difficile]|uniref:Phage protein n=2 Tax=Leicestervirus CD382 TaxID=2843973 RepID=A0A1J1JCG1_9CAUD|nr:hypothetical protein [Clostridioides difficile]ALY06949.1 hypothetical protein CDHS1_6 [Clostridium phage CDSH1]CUL03820.1 hypothetical protein [Clostridium phage slur17]MCP8652576.1 hypothetical protein [Clostridioides difficile]MDM0194110.1 hypothetical protein [Clostridioides difficile]MDN9274933.1 hypothetical protein [Clostridioides difficile]